MSDVKGILRSVKKKDYVMYVVYLVESSIARVNADLKKFKRSPTAIVQSTIIFDMEGFSMSHITTKQGMYMFYFTINNIASFEMCLFHSS